MQLSYTKDIFCCTFALGSGAASGAESGENIVHGGALRRRRLGCRRRLGRRCHRRRRDVR